ncbi:MAG: phage tail protein [Saprospiraceae bacterium]
MREYHPVNFHYRVEFLDLPGRTPEDIKFQSVTGLSVDFNTDSFKEGGENRFEHIVPARTKYPELVLKRGLYLPGKSGLTDWCNKAFDNFIFQPVNLNVQLLNENHETLVQWKVVHAWPKSWEFGELNAEDGKILIETFKLNYNYFRYRKP